MRILIKVIRFIFVFFLFSIGMTIIRETRISILVYLWIIIGCYYAIWEFGFLKKKDKHKNIKEKTIENPGGQKNENK